MSIPFTQYLMPDGRKKLAAIEMEAEVEAKAKTLLEKGCHFDIEVLNTGMISMTCEKGEELISIAICENNFAVVDSVRLIIDKATEMLRERGK